jgi:hypothetical protein
VVKPAEIAVVLQALDVDRELGECSVTGELLLEFVDGSDKTKL